MAEAPAPGVQFPQPLVNPPQVPQVLQAPQAPQAMNPPARAAGQIAPARQLVQVNVANAQDELKVNFDISVSLSILDFLVVSLLWSHYGSGYISFMLRTSFSFTWAYYVCFLSYFNGALAYQGRGFLSRGIRLCLALVVDSFQFLLWVEPLLPFVLSLLLGCWPLYCIFSLWCRSHVGMRLRLTFWLFYVALFEFVQP